MSEVHEVTIEMVEFDDAAALLDYAKQVGSETEFLEFGKEGLDISVEQEALYIQAVYESETQMMLVARCDGEIIAVGSISGRVREKMAHIGEIGVSVLKAYWGQGLASHLMTELLYWAKVHSPLTRIELEVVKENYPAIHLYEKLGFVQEGVMQQAIRLSDGYHDVVKMALLLEKES